MLADLSVFYLGMPIQQSHSRIDTSSFTPLNPQQKQVWDVGS